MNGYSKNFHKNNKNMNVLVNDKKNEKIYWKCNKIKNLFKKEFNGEPVYSDKYIKTKIKIYNDRVYINFQYSKISLKLLNITKFYFCWFGEEDYWQIFRRM